MQDPITRTPIWKPSTSPSAARCRASATAMPRSGAPICWARGWVQNMEDGTVEALVQGTPDQVDHMLEWLRRGPGAWVAEIVTRREYTDKRYIRFEQL